MVSTRCRHRNGAATTATEQHVQLIIYVIWSSVLRKISSDIDVYNTKYNTNLLMKLGLLQRNECQTLWN